MAKPKKDTNSIKSLSQADWELKSAAIEGWAVKTHKLLKDVLVNKKNVKDLSTEYEVSRQYIYKTVDRFNALFDKKD